MNKSIQSEIKKGKKILMTYIQSFSSTPVIEIGVDFSKFESFLKSSLEKIYKMGKEDNEHCNCVEHYVREKGKRYWIKGREQSKIIDLTQTKMYSGKRSK